MNVNVTTEMIRPVMARSARRDSGASVDIGVSAGLISLKKRDSPIGWAETCRAGRFFRTRRIAERVVGEGLAEFCGAEEEFASSPQRAQNEPWNEKRLPLFFGCGLPGQ